MLTPLVCLVMLALADDQSADSAKLRQRQVERAARMYRIEVYESFRLDRAEYDRRRKAGDDLLLSWSKSDQTAEQAELATEWFAAGRESIQAEGGQADLAVAPVLPAKAPEAAEGGESLVSADEDETGPALTTPTSEPAAAVPPPNPGADLPPAPPAAGIDAPPNPAAEHGTDGPSEPAPLAP